MLHQFDDLGNPQREHAKHSYSPIEILSEKQMAAEFFKNYSRNSQNLPASPNKQGKDLHSCVNLMILELLNRDSPSIPYVLLASPLLVAQWPDLQILFNNWEALPSHTACISF